MAQFNETFLNDSKITSHKGNLLKYIRDFSKKNPDGFLNLTVNADVLDLDVCSSLSQIYCSLNIEFSGESKNGSYLFDKKFFSKRAQTLNNIALVFGFDMDFALKGGDSVKLFRDRLDFALSLYPNHVYFPQLVSGGGAPTATFSTQDIRKCSEIANAVETFYSYGRSVTWFLAVLKPLKMPPSKFFQDFSEWQEINNCGLKTGWKPSEAKHSEIERMQLEFLEFKYEEKGKEELFEVVSNIVRLNGALSRCYGEGEESVVELSYNPDELLGYGAMEIQKFFENSIQENSHVKIFMGDEGPDYKYC